MRIAFVSALAVLISATSFYPATANTTGGTQGGGEVVSENKCDFNDILAGFESKGAGGYQAENRYGYLGKYQMGKSALTDLGYMKNGGWTGKDGIYSNADFKNSPAVQEKAQESWKSLLGQRMAGSNSFLGSNLSCGKPLTQSGMLMGAHLVGPGGASEYLKSGGFCGKAGQVSPSGHRLRYNTIDGNNTCAGKYMCAGSGCETISKDMNKKTCEVVMPMIEAISCEKMPAGLQSFCNTYKPYLMTRSECSDAESMAEKAEKGPNKEQCENLSFGPGTGSWSFVLACSFGGEFVADQDGQQNPDGPMSDPACVEKLKGMGVQPRVLGQYNYSTGGQSCIVENAVSVNGAAVPFGKWVTMTCDMAVALEQWGQKLKGLGVTGYTDVQSLSCRQMRTKNGVKKNMSEHAYGRAVDIPGLLVGGRRISFGAIHKPATPEGAIVVQARQMACATFRQVLSPLWSEYAGAYVHFHVEWGKYRSCN